MRFRSIWRSLERKWMTRRFMHICCIGVFGDRSRMRHSPRRRKSPLWRMLLKLEHSGLKLCVDGGLDAVENLDMLWRVWMKI